MAFTLPKDWEKESDKLFVHESGIRISRMVYKGKEGWFLIPVDLDQAVVEFDPSNEGRDKAFEAFDTGVLIIKPKKAKVTAKKVKEPPPEEEDAKLKDKDKDGDKEKDKDGEDKDEDEDEKETEEDEGDDD